MITRVVIIYTKYTTPVKSPSFLARPDFVHNKSSLRRRETACLPDCFQHERGYIFLSPQKYQCQVLNHHILNIFRVLKRKHITTWYCVDKFHCVRNLRRPASTTTTVVPGATGVLLQHQHMTLKSSFMIIAVITQQLYVAHFPHLAGDTY